MFQSPTNALLCYFKILLQQLLAFMGLTYSMREESSNSEHKSSLMFDLIRMTYRSFIEIEIILILVFFK